MADPPAVHATTRRLYDALPEHYREADAAIAGPPDYPLLRWLSLVGDQLGELEDLIDDVNYVTAADGGTLDDTSDLVDPAAARPEWLPWLGQLVGARVNVDIGDDARRGAIAGASAGWRAGTKPAIVAAAQSALTGTRYARVVDHYAGDQWALAVITRFTETPDAAAVADAIAAQRAKPAGFTIEIVAYSTTWAVLEANRPTWADWEAAGSWAVLEETGLP